MSVAASRDAKDDAADTLSASPSPVEPSIATAPRRAEQERSQVSRRRLIEAAVSALMDMGYSGMTLSAIARRAGLTTGAVQYHFGSKDDLLLEMLDVLFLGTSFLTPESETEASAEGVGLYRRCEIFVERSMHTYGQPNYFLIWEIIIATRRDPALNARVAAARNDVVAEWLGRFRRLFAELAVPEEEALELINFVNGHLRGISLLNRYGPITRETWARQKRLITDALYSELSAFAGGTVLGSPETNEKPANKGEAS